MPIELNVGKNYDEIDKTFDWQKSQDQIKQLYICEGGSGCFDGGQQVVTNKGLKPIKDIYIGDMVLSYNETTKLDEYKEVNHKFKYKNKKKCYRVGLRDGSYIIATEDHKFYFEGRWVSLKYILSLFYDKSK